METLRQSINKPMIFRPPDNKQPRADASGEEFQWQNLQNSMNYFETVCNSNHHN